MADLRKLMLRGLGWLLCLGLWSVALLTTFPVAVNDAVTPAAMRFPVAKLLHVSAYAFLTLYITWLPLRRGRWLMLVVLSLHAAGSEYCQQFVPGRNGAASDVLIDHVGILLGAALTWKLWLPRRTRLSVTRLPSSSSAPPPAAFAERPT